MSCTDNMPDDASAPLQGAGSTPPNVTTPATTPATTQATTQQTKRTSSGFERALGIAGVSAAVCSILAACTGPAPAPQAAPEEPSSLGIPGEPALGTRPTSPSQARLPLPPPGPVRNMEQVRLQAARRMVAANAGETYVGKPPEVLLAIPVLEIELNADGSVRRVVVLRKPTQALDTTQLAIAAVGRAAPFGDVSRLPRPWKFVETFLFDDDRRFKPRTLEE